MEKDNERFAGELLQAKEIKIGWMIVFVAAVVGFCIFAAGFLYGMVKNLPFNFL
jgi:type III secretory pathway component EscT